MNSIAHKTKRNHPGFLSSCYLLLASCFSKRITHYALLTTLFALIATSGLLQAQSTPPNGIYPVDTRLIISPPYSPYLSDYSQLKPGSTNPPVQAYIQLRDPLKLELEVHVGIWLRKAGTTEETYRTQIGDRVTFVLKNGEAPKDLFTTPSINGSSIQELFEKLAIQAGNKDEIPSEVYTVSLDVFAKTTDGTNQDQQVSNPNTGFSIINVQKSEHPLPILPADKSEESAKLPQNVLFQWLPRHVETVTPKGQPLLYHFRLVKNEIGQDPVAILMSDVPDINKIVDKYVVFPYYQLTQADLLLEHGATYSWQVTVETLDPSDNKTYSINDPVDGVNKYFKNNTATPFSFTYKLKCPQVTGAILSSADLTGTQNLKWTDPLLVPESQQITKYVITSKSQNGIVNSTDYNLTIPQRYSQNAYSLPLNTTYLPNYSEAYDVSIQAVCQDPQNTTTITNASDVYVGQARVISTKCPELGPQLVKVSAPTSTNPVPPTGTVKVNWEPISTANYYSIETTNDNTTTENTTWTVTTGSSLATIFGTSIEFLPVDGANNYRVKAHCTDKAVAGTEFKLVNAVYGGCKLPSLLNFKIAKAGANQYMLSWIGSDFFTGYTLKYRMASETPTEYIVSSPIAFDKPNITLTLEADKQYEYILDFSCSDNQKVSTLPGIFKTPADQIDVLPSTGDCFPPANTMAIVKSETEAEFVWDKVEGAKKYTVYYALAENKTETDLNNAKWTKIDEISKARTLVSGLQIIAPTTGVGGVIIPEKSKYVFIVKATCQDGRVSIASDQYEFDLKAAPPVGACTTAIILEKETVSTNAVTLKWTHSSYASYKVTFRDQQDPVTKISQHVYTVSATTVVDGNAVNANVGDVITKTIPNLKPGRTYEFQVEGTCADKGKKTSLIVEATTTLEPKPVENFNCGQQSGAPGYDITTCGQKRPALGKVFKAADFDIVVDKANIQKGYLVLPMGNFAEATVRLENVEMDVNDQMCRGQVILTEVAVYPIGKDATEQLAAFRAKLDKALEIANTVLDETEKVLNEAEKYFAGGNKVGKVISGTGPTIIPSLSSEPVAKVATTKPEAAAYETISNVGVSATTGSGSSGTGTGSGEGTGGTGTGSGVGTGTGGTNTTTVPTARITFSDHKDAIYDFDAYQTPLFDKSEPLKAKYELLKNGQYVASKFIQPNIADRVTVRFEGSDFDASKIRFVNRPTKNDNSGASLAYDNTKQVLEYQIEGNWTNKTATLLLAGGPDKDAQEIYALYNDGTKEYAIGKLLVPSYSTVTKNLVLIPVAKTDIATQYKVAVENMLQKTYGRIGMNWKVTIAPFYDNDSWDADKDGKVQSSGSTAFSNDYTGEERSLVQNYSATSTVDPKTAYLFILPEQAVGTSAELLGKMPHQEQFGFVFAGTGTAGNYSAPDKIAHTVAHELGHGAHFLDHPFHPYLGLSQGGSDNLMDYRGDTQLWKMQWDQIHDPGHVWGVFKRDDDAALVANEYYYMPTGVPIKFNFSASTILYVKDIGNGLKINGAVYGFTIDNKNYESYIENGKFFGYYIDGDKTKTRYENVTDYEILKNKQIKVRYVDYIGNCKVNYYYYKYQFGNFITADANLKLIGEDVVSSLVGTKESVIALNTKADGNCSDIIDENAPLQAGSLGKEFADFYKLLIDNPTSENKLIKIGNLVNKLGRPLYNEFVLLNNVDNSLSNHFDWWKYILSKDPNANFTDLILDKIYTEIKAFDRAMYELRNKSFSSSDEFITFCNTNFVVGTDSKVFFDGVFAGLTSNRRNILLNLFKDKTPNEIVARANIGLDIQEEEVILALLRKAPLIQGKDVILNFITTSPTLVKIIIDGFSDVATLSTGNFEELIQLLTSFVTTGYRPANSADLLAYNKYILFNDGFWSSNSVTTDPDEGTISFDLGHKLSQTLDYSASANIHEYILCEFANEIEFKNIKLVKGTRYRLPAIFVYGIFQQDFRNKLKDYAKLTFDVVSLATGIGELNAAIKAASWTSAVLAASDIAVGSADIVIGTLFKNEIEAQFPRFYNNWQTLAAAQGIFMGAVDGIKQIHGETWLESKWLKSHASNPNDRLQAEKIFNRLNQVEYTEFIDDINDGLRITRQNLGTVGNQLDDVIVDRIKNKFSSSQKAALKQDLETNNQLITDFNNDPKKLDDWLLEQLAGKLVDNLNLGNFVKKIGDYDVFSEGEIFYRGMSQADYQYLLTNGKIRAPLNSPTAEVFTSPSLEYIKSVGYGGDGVIVKFKMKSGTLDNLVSNGVRDQSNRAATLFPNMQSTNISGWEANGKVYFKQETIKNTTTKQVNIGLGKNENGGLKYFNGENGSNILEFQIVQ